MPVSAFGRRASNAASSSQMARSSSSSNPGPPSPAPHPSSSQYMTGYPTSDNAAMTAGRHYTTGSPGPAAGGVGVAMTNLSEFGTLGGGPFAIGSLGRSHDAANSTNSSPSQSPIVGGGSQSVFSSSVPPGMTTHPLTGQPFPASNIDGQSGHTPSTFSSLPPFELGSSSSTASQTDKIFRETFLRRVAMLSYLKRCISIASYPSSSQAHNASITPAWLDVIKLSKRDLEAMYEPEKMKRRTTRNYTLGCSIAPLLEYNNSAECTKAILATFNEVESIGEGADRDKAKMKNFFKTSIRGTRRGVAGTDWETGLDSLQGGPSTDLLGYHVPFSLDFFQTTITLYDVLMEMYHKFIWFLAQHQVLPVPNSASSTEKTDPSMMESLSSPLTTSTLETMSKVDGKVKKLLSQTCKELDALVRHVIREELASVDPMMARELGLLEGTSSADTSMNQTND